MLDLALVEVLAHAQYGGPTLVDRAGNQLRGPDQPLSRLLDVLDHRLIDARDPVPLRRDKILCRATSTTIEVPDR